MLYMLVTQVFNKLMFHILRSYVADRY